MIFWCNMVLSLALSFAVTYFLVPLFSLIAFKYSIVDMPDGVVKMHKKPTPYLGGIAVYLGFLTAVALIFPLYGPFFLVLVGSTLLLFIGLIDDLMQMSPQQKFLAQMVVVFCFLKSGLYLKTHFFASSWSIAISALWCLTVINAFNLIDVMDGLASTVAALIATSMMIMALYYGHFYLALWLMIFLGAIIAFLCFNYQPASIYLGDAGSLFLGGFLAPIPFLFNWGTYNLYGYLTPIILFAIPLIEVATLIIIRTYKRIPFYKPSPDHFCLYFKRNGWSIPQILAYMICVASIQLMIAFLFMSNHIGPKGLFACMIAALVAWYTILFKVHLPLSVPRPTPGAPLKKLLFIRGIVGACSKTCCFLLIFSKNKENF